VSLTLADSDADPFDMAVLREVKRFEASWLADLAKAAEAAHGTPFEGHGASLRIRPNRWAHVSCVGEGLSLDLDPHHPGKWEWWGDFESTLEVRRRGRLGGEWVELLSPDEVAAWVDREIDAYLAQLA
jgi:hypothetical protein